MNCTDSAVEGKTANIINKFDQIDPTNSVDLYMAGDSHTYTDGTVGRVRVVQTLSFGTAFDNVKATYYFKTNDFTSEPTADIVAIDPNKGVTSDPTVANIVSSAKKITDSIAAQTIGTYSDPAHILLSGRSSSA